MAHKGHHQSFDTLGIVVDLHDEEGRNLAQETVSQTKCPEFRNLLNMAQTLKKRYIVAAGRFNGKGISGTLCDDVQHLIVAFQMVNARMDEIGSRTTAWVIKPEECAVLLGQGIPSKAKSGEK